MCLNRISQIKDTNNQLIARYDYDIWDNRIAKTTYKDGQATTTYYFYNQDGLLAETNAQGLVMTQYGFAPSDSWQTSPLFIKTDKGYAYYHNDQLGTPRLATDKNGNVVWQADYATNGEATLSSNNQITSNLRFPGQYFDAESNLHYNTRRYYDPKIGRYITQDPIGYQGGANLYLYANSSPVIYIDPTGEWWFGDPINQGIVDGVAGFGDSLSLGLTRVARDAWNIDGVNKCSTSYRHGETVGTAWGMAIGVGGMAKAGYTGYTGITNVTRWGSSELRAGNWVMEGGATRLNYYASFKWQPGMSNIYTPFAKNKRFLGIASSDLRYPPPPFFAFEGGWKGIFFGQKVYAPGSPGVPAWIYDTAKNAVATTAYALDSQCGCK